MSLPGRPSATGASPECGDRANPNVVPVEHAQNTENMTEPNKKQEKTDEHSHFAGVLASLLSHWSQGRPNGTGSQVAGTPVGPSRNSAAFSDADHTPMDHTISMRIAQKVARLREVAFL